MVVGWTSGNGEGRGVREEQGTGFRVLKNKKRTRAVLLAALSVTQFNTHAEHYVTLCRRKSKFILAGSDVTMKT